MQLRLPLASTREARAWLVALLRTHRREFTLVMTLFGTATAAGLVGPQLLGRLVDGVSKGAHGEIDELAIAFVAVLLVHATLRRFARLRGGILGERVLAANREQFVARALRLPLSTVEAAGTGDLLSRATSDVNRIDFSVRYAVPEIAISVIGVLLTVIAMVATSPLLALGMLTAVVPVVLACRWYFHRVPATVQRMLARWADVQSGLHETADGARTADALGLIERRVRYGEAELADAVDGELALRSLQVRWVPWLELSHVLPIAAMLALGAVGYANGWVGLGTIATMVLYAQALAAPLDEALWWMEDLTVSATALRRVLGVTDLAEPIRGTITPKGRDIVLTGVHFGYRAGQEVLHGIDLTVPAGQRLAVVGPSGAGKSTLARLLAGIARPTSGSVTVGGAEIGELTEDVLRAEMLLLTQEHHVFAGTLRENLALPTRSVGGQWSDRELLDALGSVGALRWARSLPDGLDTVLGSGSRAVASSVAQQLALARVVLADPHTIVLDEATSLLDVSSARELERSLAAVLAGRTVIAIAHRLHTAATADRVVVLSDGRISEDGSHRELLAVGGPYARLVAAAGQAS